MNNSLKSFTIIEMLVSMLVASILLLLAWNLVLYANDYKKLIEGKAQQTVSMERMKYWIKKDITSSASIELMDDELKCLGHIDTSLYVFSGNSIVRYQGLFSDSTNVGGTFSLDTISGEFGACFIINQQANECFTSELNASSELKVNKLK